MEPGAGQRPRVTQSPRSWGAGTDDGTEDEGPGRSAGSTMFKRG